MSTFKAIKGHAIKSYAGNPANPKEGQIWYNSTSQTLKGSEFASAVWASGGNLNTKRMGAGGAGTQTAGAILGADNDGVEYVIGIDFRILIRIYIFKTPTYTIQFKRSFSTHPKTL